ncbi:hypothetical protein ACQY1Q_02055 [Tenacibaculum sp. TC6]|uniref:hypothetical protein n=1 Tax=Tenacibaculum sp. TC6 TaxID=3423223 RepID=UPI003D368CB8
MKSNKVNLNHEIISRWTDDTKYLIEVFSSIIEHLELVLVRIETEYVIFKGYKFKITFKYDVNIDMEVDF